MSQNVVTVTALSPPMSRKRAALSRVLPAGVLRRLIETHRRTRTILALAGNGLYDLRRYLRWSSAGREELSQAQLAALVTLNYHRLEKGLALKTPRPGFGQDAVRLLMSLLDRYVARYGVDDTARAGIDTLDAYRAFGRTHGLNHPEVDAAIARLGGSRADGVPPCGGTIPVDRATVAAAAPADPEAFFATRHSVRQFADAEVDMDTIARAVRMAQRTPSVCNRQSWKVHVFSDAEQKRRVLSFQNGNRGFGDQASKVLVVTSDLQHFTSVGERFQCWIDGGLFAMSLVYALHALGLGTCMLNWSVVKETDRAMRATAGIPDNEVVIMMIAVGHLPETLSVAHSLRKPLEEVLIAH
ncbi:nitroreductase family protein [Azospirillum halopraeferens]|uniref:nitroreductase family protein n=1 Tax=Azospirillum halopraeferens TaxID=34010 RepID=UPI00040B3A7C|nr:nitroreductase family protein [Azospirillum halopraeferens]